MVILGHLIKGTFSKKEGEYVMELYGRYDKSIKDAIFELIPSTVDIFKGNYRLTVNLVLEEIKTTTSTSMNMTTPNNSDSFYQSKIEEGK